MEDDLRKDEDYPDQEVEDNRQYCICNKPSNDNMVACDNENCKIKWFHYECVISILKKSMINGIVLFVNNKCLLIRLFVELTCCSLFLNS